MTGRGALGRPRLDWTRCRGRPEECMCLHAGEQAAWGEVVASLHGGRTRASRSTRANADERRRPVSVSPCRHQSRAGGQQQQQQQQHGTYARGRAASVFLLLSVARNNRLVTRRLYNRLSWVGDGGGLAIGSQSRQSGRWPLACFAVR